MRNPAIEVTNPINPGTGNNFFVIYWGKWWRTGAVIFSQCLRLIDLTWLARWERMQNCSLCVLANRQAGHLMVVHQGAGRSWHIGADMADSAHLSEDRAHPPNIETTFTLRSFSFHRGKLQFEVYCNHLIVWSYRGFIKKSNCDDVHYENEGTYICAFCL